MNKITTTIVIIVALATIVGSYYIGINVGKQIVVDSVLIELKNTGKVTVGGMTIENKVGDLILKPADFKIYEQ